MPERHPVDTRPHRSILSVWEQQAHRYRVELPEAVLIALSLYGIHDRLDSRVRLTLRPTVEGASPTDEHQVMVLTGRAGSPFRLHLAPDATRESGLRPTGELRVENTPVAIVTNIEADERPEGPLRADGRLAVIGPGAGSRCPGCGCPLSAVTSAPDFEGLRTRPLEECTRLLRTIADGLPPGRRLTDLEEVLLTTACCEAETAVLVRARALRQVLRAHDVPARISLVTCALRSDQAFRLIAQDVAPALLLLSIEHFTRRPLLLPAGKASLTPTAMPGLLAHARAAGLDTSLTYSVGLDPLEELSRRLRALAPHLTVFPHLEVFQGRTPLTEALRVRGAHQLAYYLRARRLIEEILAPHGLRPQPWPGARTLWYGSFAGSPLTKGTSPMRNAHHPAPVSERLHGDAVPEPSRVR